MNVKILIVLAVLATPAIPQAYIAPSVPPEKIDLLVRAASEMSRYPIPPGRPKVVIMPAALMPGAFGLFIRNTPDTVYVNESTPVEWRATVLVHEFVHYLQFHAGTLPENQTCDQRAYVEAEAYVAAYRFELTYLKFHHPLTVDASNCENLPGAPNDPK